MSTELNGAAGLVTGAAAGIGRATAFALADRGAKVVLADLSPKGEEVAREITAKGQTAHFVQCDSADSDQVAELIAEVPRRFGSLDVAFNNAGINLGNHPAGQTPLEEFDKLIGVNLRGVWLCLQHELRWMADHGGGAIVNTASYGAIRGIAGLSGYTAAKHGVAGLTRTAALDYASQGIRVNAVAPGVIATQMIADLPADVQAGFAAEQPCGRFGDPDEVADVVVWLCSPQSSYISGVVLPVDFAWSCR